MSLTNLQAINQMLTSVGETAVLTIVEGASDTTNAQTVLDAETTKVLVRGWHCNTDEAVTLNPDGSGRIAVPADALQIDPTDTRRDYTQRNGFVWDRAENSNVIGEPVEFRIIRSLPFESLPFALQQRIVAQAIVKYQRAYVGSTQLDAFNREELLAAHAEAEDAEVEGDDYNILDNPDVAPIAYRFTAGRSVL